MKLSGSNIKIFLIFSQKKAFHIFWETENSSYFSGRTSKAPKTKISYISQKKVINKFF